MEDQEFREFYQASWPRLRKQLVLVAGDAGEGEDALQEAFIRAAASWRRVRVYDAPEAWVRRVALNLAANTARRARRRAALLLRLGPAPPPLDLDPELVDLATGLRALSREQRTVIVLHHLAGLPVGEIAGELGIPAGTVKTRLHRGRAALARALAVHPEEVTHG